MAGANTVEVTIKVIDEASKKLQNVNKETSKMEKGMKMLGKAVAAVGIASLAKQAGQFALEATKYAARVETLGIVTKTLGANAGYSETRIRELEKAIQKKGITTEKSREALAKMMQAELDLAKATDLARLAQDAAVISGTNSSEAFSRLVDVISTGNVRMARTMGLQVDFNAANKEMAKSLGKTVDELTAQEKAQARTNAVLKEGSQISGAYEASMKSVGKQLESTKRYWDEYRLAIGEAQVGLIGWINLVAQDWLQASTDEINYLNLKKTALEEGAITLQEVMDTYVVAGGVTLSYAEAIEMLTVELEKTRYEAEGNISTNFELINANRELGKSYESTNVAVTDTLSGLKEFSKESMALRTAEAFFEQYTDAKSLGGVLITEDEATHLENLLITADALPDEFDEMITGFNTASGVIKTDAEKLNADLIAAFEDPILIYFQGVMSDIPGGVDLSDGSPPKKGKKKRIGGYKPEALGGPLASVALVGEQGPELVVHGNVIPATQTRKILGSGLIPGRRYGTGGAIGTGSEYLDSLPSAYHGWLDPATGARGDYTGPGSAAAASKSISSYLSGGSGAGLSSVAASSAAAGAATGAVGVAQTIAMQISGDSAITQQQNAEIIDILRELATAEDIENGMRTALEQAML